MIGLMRRVLGGLKRLKSWLVYRPERRYMRG
jgi:hypothetical protein